MSGYGHDHGTGGTSQCGKLMIVFAITFTVMAAEIIGALMAGSLVLVADADHMFADSTGLLIALIAASLALNPVTLKRTWGYKGAEIIAAAFQAALPLGMGGFEGIRSSTSRTSPAPRCSGSESSAWLETPSVRSFWLPAGTITST